MLKSAQFMDRLESVGAGVEVYAEALLLKPEAMVLGDGVRVDDFCRLEGGAGLVVGAHVHISSFSSVFGGGRCLIGDGVGIAQGARVVTGSDQADAVMSAVAPPEWRHVESSTCVLDHLSFLAVNAVVLPGCTVGVGAIVAAGSVLRGSVPPWEVWAGVPARRVSVRDPEPLRRRGVPVEELEARSLAASPQP